ncbi:MAG: M12 family metallo-peptidase [Candidatus Kapabacteria bacterium]|nr:M12 family metallo-peptidase [Candidatus Kapabacteria bacterium]
MKFFINNFLILVISLSTLVAKDFTKLNSSQIFSNYKQKVFKSDKADLQNVQKSVTTFQLNKSSADAIFTDNSLIINDFPVSLNDKETIVLEKIAPIVDQNTIWLENTENGIRRFKGPQLRSFTGYVAAHPDRKVFINYSEGFINGYCEAADGISYDLSSAAANAETDDYTVTISEQNINAAIEESQIFNCMTTEPDLSNFKSESKDSQAELLGKSTNLIECKIAIEGAYNYYKIMGSNLPKASAYIASVMAHVSHLYEIAINVRIILGAVQINTSLTSDPYEGKYNNLQERLSAMPSIWSNKIPSGSTLVCLFSSLTAQPAGDVVAGISFGGYPGTGSICSKQRGYSVFGITGDSKYPNYNYTWDVSVSAHEIGHNFGAPHTHNCDYYQPAIDTCVTRSGSMPVGDACTVGAPKPIKGTIMSYCHVTNSTRSVELYFHPRQIPDMRIAAAKASCMALASKPYISIIGPLELNTYRGGSTMNICWTSSAVTNVAIKYSFDNGSTWNTIQSSFPAVDSLYKWITPILNTTTGKILVCDASNSATADTTDVTFTNVVPEITFSAPAINRKYGQHESFNIIWASNYSSIFKVEYTSDGGVSWNILKNNYNSFEYLWTLPDIISNNCRIRVTDATDNTIVGLSPTFSIGLEKFEIITPIANQKLCMGQQFTINWTYDNVSGVFLYYSTDSGSNWKKVVIIPLDATLQTYTWNVPSISAPNVIIRVCLQSDVTYEITRTAYTFAIDSCATNVHDVKIDGFDIISIDPNPVKNIATIKYNCSNNTMNQLHFYITDLNGRIVLDNEGLKADCANSEISFDCTGLSTGSYIFYAQSNNKVNSFPFLIVR